MNILTKIKGILKERSKERKTIKANKVLIARYPFLKPTNRWTGETSKDYDYTWTEIDEMPYGWFKAFGIEMLEELREALIEGGILNTYRITQVKEKYGSLRWYDAGATEKVYTIINKYENLSERTCIACGDKATRMSIGWISPFCQGCADKGNRKTQDIDKFLYGEDEEEENDTDE